MFEKSYFSEAICCSHEPAKACVAINTEGGVPEEYAA